MRDRYLFPGASMTATEYRSAVEGDGRPEVRHMPLELRDFDGKTLVGRAIVFGSPSVDMGGWDEVIQRGATRKVLATKPDTRLLINHDGLPLARTKAGTLTLREEPQGLDWQADLPDIGLARDLAVLIERGDIDQMSFAFRVAPGGATWTELAEGRERRTVTEIAHLPEISIVTFPAYEATNVTTSTRADDGAAPQEAPTDREEVEADAAEQRQTDIDGVPDPAGATTGDSQDELAEWIAARRRRHYAQRA